MKAFEPSTTIYFISHNGKEYDNLIIGLVPQGSIFDGVIMYIRYKLLT